MYSSICVVCLCLIYRSTHSPYFHPFSDFSTWIVRITALTVQETHREDVNVVKSLVIMRDFGLILRIVPKRSHVFTAIQPGKVFKMQQQESPNSIRVRLILIERELRRDSKQDEVVWQKKCWLLSRLALKLISTRCLKCCTEI